MAVVQRNKGYNYSHRTTNYVNQNQPKCLSNLIETLPQRDVLFLHSLTADLDEAGQKDQIWCKCRMPKLLQDLLEDSYPANSERIAINKYAHQRIEHNGEGFC